MKLYFENAAGVSRPIAECKTESEAVQHIYKFVKECNKNKPKENPFVIYYIRRWIDNGKTWYDVGSHAEFFYVDKELKEDNENYN